MNETFSQTLRANSQDDCFRDSYHFEQLPVGVYKLTFDLPGFHQYVPENIQINAGFSAEVKVQLSVGMLRFGVIYEF